MLRCRSLLKLQRRTFCTYSTRLNSIPNWSIRMPGFNLPLNEVPDANVLSGRMSGFPNALDPEQLRYERLDQLLTKREITMMQIMNVITDKTELQRKVFDEHITAKWRKDIAQSGEDVSSKMMDWIIQELQWKAGVLKQTGFVEVFDSGVVKSDTAISKELQQALKEAVYPLEDVPEEERDFHPGSDGKVINLVHPSHFPVIYGRTRVLPDRTIGIDECLESMGEGQLLARPNETEAVPQAFNHYGIHNEPHPPVLSTKFQWLPCDVKILEDGKCRLLSYINNAHPIRYRALYAVVERILAQTIPLWEQTVSERGFDDVRIQYSGQVQYEDDGTTEPENEGLDDEEYEERSAAWYSSRKIVQPEPGTFKVREPEYKANFLKHFPEGKIQVIVKLANIELTPDKPEYEGGTWHIEGQLNERIAASAIYYYDSENITPSFLAFRHRGMSDMSDISYEQDCHDFMQKVFGYHDELDNYNDNLITQELGSVLCKPGRMITFPNTLQHRVSPFSLADRSKPGHRKILALFLVDPHVRIISSANVPPQREDWRLKIQKRGLNELQEPLGDDAERAKLMTMEEAIAYRLELMQERGLRSQEQNDAYEMGHFALCEH